ncbi:hypothetical protein FOL47_001341 [Perkinsus chesapeaki]|uniref:Reverse transcriptase domain-containing protein n=1 Tax=Perkinsus chesapeaki TaxID=330153 RepID=A0A7J6KSF9_PERCH|nr:hypothetical protein FOL47_001341 [Perkinsus chesapeaki]
MVPTSDETPTSPHVALIDTGSCDSMISLDLVEDLRLPIKYLDVPYTAYIMNGDSIMYHATVTLTWRFHDGPDKDFSSTFLVSPRLPQPFAFVLGSDLQRSEGFFFNPTTNEMVFTPVRPQEDHIHLPPTSNDDPDKNIASDATRHYEANSTIIVMQTPHFIITAEPDQLDASKKIFTVDIKPDAMPPKKPRPARLQQRHHLNQQQKEDPTLYNETQEKLQGLIERGCLKPVLDDDQQNDDYYYLTTTYYGVRGSKRARPVFPFGSLNRATKEMLKECPTRQESLYSILDSTRGFDLLQLLDVSDAFFRIQTGVNLRELLTVFIDGRRYSFCNMPYGPNISPFILLACMSHVCTTTKCPYSIKYYMDDIATNHPQPQQLQELFAAYDFPTTLVDVATVDTAPFLGLETADYGRLLQYSEKGWRNFTSFQMPAHPSLRQSLMLLGRIMSIPESLIAKYYRQVLCWDAPLPDELSCMLREFHDLYKDTNLPQLQRYIDPSESLHIYTDAGAYCGCYRFFQNGNEVLRGQYSFSATECALHINYKEFLMVLQALQRLVLLETRTGYQFQSLNVYVDSKTVLAILKHGRIKAGPMQVYIEKKFRLLQELLGERLYDINFSYVETSNNLADIGTRNDLHRRLVHLRDYSKEPFAEEVCHPLQAAVIPAQQVPTGKRKRQIAPTDADPVIKKQCIRPANRVLVTRDILLAECREKQELLDKKILTLDTLGYARLSGTQRLYIPQPIQQDLLRSYHEYYAHPGVQQISVHSLYPLQILPS